MTDKLTLAHVSDLHLTPIVGFAPRYWNVKRVLGYLNWLKGRRSVHRLSVADALIRDARQQGVDHILVSGDLVNIGLPEELALARDWLASLGPPDRVTVVPGNHDIYTALMHGTSCLDLWAANMSPCPCGRELMLPGPAPFPFVRCLGPVALIGLNSAVPQPPFVAAGRLGKEQLGRLDHVLGQAAKAGLFRVVVIHHPPLIGLAPRRRALEDARELEALLARRGADLVLHGHNHQDTLASTPSVPGPVPVAGIASGSAAKAHGREPLARYRLITIERTASGVGIGMVTRGLLAPEGAIGEISRYRPAA
ncbi:MAG: metallophosphoesterase family protein [Hyphomicrobium sp.]